LREPARAVAGGCGPHAWSDRASAGVRAATHSLLRQFALMRVAVLLLLGLLAAACGGGSSKQNVPKNPPPSLASRCGDAAHGVDAKLVWFRASDGALLDGAAVGDG